MRLNIKHILGAAALAVAATASAQTSYTGYFLEDYTYRFMTNPAYGNSKNFVSMPVLNMNVGLNGNLNLDDVLYNVNGRTTTFLNPKLSANEVLGNLSESNKLGLDVRASILSIGFKGIGGYNTINLGIRSSAGVNLPYSIFSLLKEGVENKSYDISNIHAFGTAYVELGLGHSHQITDDIRVGANVKLLLGAGNVDVDLMHADLKLGVDQWTVRAEGQANVNMKGFEYKTKRNEDTGHMYVNDVDIDSPGLSGIGAAVDLGVVYSPSFFKDIEISASVQDLGFISWNNDMLASTNGMKTFNTDKYTFNVDKEAPNSFKNEWKEIKNDFSSIYELEDMGDQGGTMRSLGATVNVGAAYAFPLYRKLKFGLLNTTRIQKDFGWTNFMVTANVAPCKVFDAAVNVNAGTFGVGYGLLLNLHCPGFNLYYGADCMASKYAKQGVPLRSKASMNVGINFLF